MGEVIAHLAMSLDGFIADPDDGCDELFGFYGSGDVAVKLSEGFPELHVSQTTADLLTAAVARAGATVVGRRLYDITNGWGGHPGGEVPMVVVTHHPPEDWPRGGVPRMGVMLPRPILPSCGKLRPPIAWAQCSSELAPSSP